MSELHHQSNIKLSKQISEPNFEQPVTFWRVKTTSTQTQPNKLRITIILQRGLCKKLCIPWNWFATCLIFEVSQIFMNDLKFCRCQKDHIIQSQEMQNGKERKAKSANKSCCIQVKSYSWSGKHLKPKLTNYRQLFSITFLLLCVRMSLCAVRATHICLIGRLVFNLSGDFKDSIKFWIGPPDKPAVNSILLLHLAKKPARQTKEKKKKIHICFCFLWLPRNRYSP